MSNFESTQPASSKDVEMIKHRSEFFSDLFAKNARRDNSIPVGEKMEVPFLESNVSGLMGFEKDLCGFTASKNGIITRFNTRGIEDMRKMGYSNLDSFTSGLSSQEQGDVRRRSNSIRRDNAITTAPSGIEQNTTTLTYMAASILHQLLPQEDFSNIFHTNKESGWYEKHLFMAGRIVSPGDISAYRMQGSNFQSLKNVTVEYSKEEFPISTYFFNVPTNMIIQEQASIMKIDILSDQLAQSAKWWASERAKALMVGPSDKAFNGYINDPSIQVDTTLFAGSYYSDLTPTQKSNVLANFIGEAFMNADATMMPNTFLISKFDSVGFGAPYSDTFPTTYLTGTSLDLGIQAAQKTMDHVSQQIGSAGVKVVSSAFVDKKINGQKTQYSLFNDDSTNVEILNPIPFTVTATVSFDGGIHLNTGVYERLGGIITKRPTSAIQFFIN
jgi:hypothetical protein